MRCGEFKFNKGMATSAQFSYYGKPVYLIFEGQSNSSWVGFFGCSSSAAAHTYLSGVAGVIVDVASSVTFLFLSRDRRRNIIYKNVILISREVCATPVLNINCAEIGDSESNSASIHAPIVNAVVTSWVVRWCCAADIVYLGCLPVCLVMRIMLGRRRWREPI